MIANFNVNKEVFLYFIKKILLNISKPFIGKNKYRELRSKLIPADEIKILQKNINFNHLEFNDELSNIPDVVHHSSSNDGLLKGAFAQLQIKKDYSFMDVGCGSGYVVYKMSGFFKKVYGLELHPKLASLATKYLKMLDVKNFEILQSDICAVNDKLLDDINVFYLYNPFQGKIMAAFLSKLKNSIIRCDRDVYVVYVNDVCKEMFEGYSDVLPLYKLMENPSWRDTRIYFHRIEAQ